MDKDILRKLPKIDDLIADDKLSVFLEELPRERVLETVREVVEERRENLLKALASSEGKEEAREKVTASLEETSLSHEAIISEIEKSLSSSQVMSLRPIINATGVVLHTNLGRAGLSKKATSAVMDVASRYSTLEYDLAKGKRGSRHSHVEDVIKRILGCEAAMLVNNNAAATLLVLAALGRGKEIIISRGELVEIGGSFRIPEIMAESGAILKDVGTTNKTCLSDYKNNINEDTAALLKVHTSNYRIVGFTESASLEELSQLSRETGLPLIYDMGSGLMVDLTEYGIDEPTVKQGLDAGADLILFSGDKLLGGPQAGIIAGRKELIDRCKVHPLVRALRVDKMTIAAMEATMKEYYGRENALKNIPALEMLSKDQETLKAEAESLAKSIEEKTEGFKAQVIEVENVSGGGSAPDSILTGFGVIITHEKLGVMKIERLLRKGNPAVVGRINKDNLILDVRSLMDSDAEAIVDRLSEIDEEKLEASLE